MARSSQSSFSIYGHINRRSRRQAQFGVADSPTPSPEADVSHAPMFRQETRPLSRSSSYSTPRQTSNAIAATRQNEESLFVLSSPPKQQVATSSAPSSTMHRMKNAFRSARRGDDSSSSQAEEVDIEQDLEVKVRGTGFAHDVLHGNYGNTMDPSKVPVPEPVVKDSTPEPAEVYGEEHRDFYLKTKRSLRGRVTTDRIFPGSKSHVPSRDNYYEPCTLEQATVKEKPKRPAPATHFVSSRESSMEPTPKRRHLLRATPKISYKIPPLLDSDLEDIVAPPRSAGRSQAKRTQAKGKAPAARVNMDTATPTSRGMSKIDSSSFDFSTKTDAEIHTLTTAWTERLIHNNADLTTQNADLTTTNADLTTQNAYLTTRNTDLTTKQSRLSALEAEVQDLRPKARAASELTATKEHLAKLTTDLTSERIRATADHAKIIQLNDELATVHKRSIADTDARDKEIALLKTQLATAKEHDHGQKKAASAPIARMVGTPPAVSRRPENVSALRARLLETMEEPKREEANGVDGAELMRVAREVVEVAAPLMGAHMGVIGERLAALKSVVQGSKREK